MAPEQPAQQQPQCRTPAAAQRTSGATDFTAAASSRARRASKRCRVRSRASRGCSGPRPLILAARLAEDFQYNSNSYIAASFIRLRAVQKDIAGCPGSTLDQPSFVKEWWSPADQGSPKGPSGTSRVYGFPWVPTTTPVYSCRTPIKSRRGKIKTAARRCRGGGGARARFERTVASSASRGHGNGNGPA